MGTPATKPEPMIATDHELRWYLTPPTTVTEPTKEPEHLLEPTASQKPESAPNNDLAWMEKVTPGPKPAAILVQEPEPSCLIRCEIRHQLLSQWGFYWNLTVWSWIPFMPLSPDEQWLPTSTVNIMNALVPSYSQAKFPPSLLFGPTQPSSPAYFTEPSQSPVSPPSISISA